MEMITFLGLRRVLFDYESSLKSNFISILSLSILAAKWVAIVLFRFSGEISTATPEYDHFTFSYVCIFRLRGSGRSVPARAPQHAALHDITPTPRHPDSDEERWGWG